MSTYVLGSLAYWRLRCICWVDPRGVSRGTPTSLRHYQRRYLTALSADLSCVVTEDLDHLHPAADSARAAGLWRSADSHGSLIQSPVRVETDSSVCAGERPESVWSDLPLGCLKALHLDRNHARLDVPAQLGKLAFPALKKRTVLQPCRIVVIHQSGQLGHLLA